MQDTNALSVWVIGKKNIEHKYKHKKISVYVYLDTRMA